MEMMTNAQFYMSNKSELNDPLDSAYTIELDNYLNLYFEKYPSLKGDEKQLELVQHVFKIHMENFDNKWIDDIDEFQSKLRLTCFTEDGNNYLMWSHYADNHSGVCLKFDTNQDENFKNELLPVEYRNELINAKTFDDLNKCLLTKLKTWELEKEWRIISSKKHFPFKQESLVEIVFGLRVPDSTIKWFTYYRESAFYMHAPVYKLKLMGNKVVKIDENGEVINIVS